MNRRQLLQAGPAALMPGQRKPLTPEEAAMLTDLDRRIAHERARRRDDAPWQQSRAVSVYDIDRYCDWMDRLIKIARGR